jgi:acyl-CoA reductase-like NAD-dependent aldehyde dehydrogenase
MSATTGQMRSIEAAAYVADGWRRTGATAEARDPYRGTVVGTVPVSDARDLSDALDAARAGSAAMASMPGHERAALLRRMAAEVDVDADELATLMAIETGKALADARIEVLRAADTLRLCAEEAVRIQGAHVPMDASPMGAGKIALTLRFPVGVVAAITPFNAPINMLAHKLGPALAAGNAVVVKPSPKAPLCAFRFLETVLRAGPAAGAVSMLFGDEVGPGLISDDRVDFVSFTGSIPVGKAIRQGAGMKRVALELGGVGPTFVAEDADIQEAAVACARNGALLAGQSCISVQNVYAHESIADAFTEAMVREVAALRLGDPLERETEIGTLIDEGSAIRVEGMVERAIDAGATLLLGGARRTAQLDPVVLADVDPTMEAVRDEVFGPVITVQRYTDPAPLFQAISDSPYGLQAGIFTDSLDRALAAFRGLRTGGVIVNGTSRWRTDQMPYGGVRDSGNTREGPHYAVHEMTETRLVVLG